MSCRSNLALCKLNVKEYEQVVDQCERVLDYDPQNTKAAFRMSQACFELSDGASVSQLRSALKYAIIAKNG